MTEKEMTAKDSTSAIMVAWGIKQRLSAASNDKRGAALPWLGASLLGAWHFLVVRPNWLAFARLSPYSSQAALLADSIHCSFSPSKICSAIALSLPVSLFWIFLSHRLEDARPQKREKKRKTKAEADSCSSTTARTSQNPSINTFSYLLIAVHTAWQLRPPSIILLGAI